MPRKGVYPDFTKDKQPHPAAGLSIATYDAKGNRRPRASRAKPKKSELEQAKVQEFMGGMNQPPSMPMENVYPPMPKSRQPVMGNPLRTYSNEKRQLISDLESYNLNTSFHPNFPQLTNYLEGEDIRFNEARRGYGAYDDSGNIKPKDKRSSPESEQDIDETTYLTTKEALLVNHLQVGEDDEYDYYILKDEYNDDYYDEDYMFKYPKDGYEDDIPILDSNLEDENPLEIARTGSDGESGNYDPDEIMDRVNYYKSLEEGKVSHTTDLELMRLISFMRDNGIELSTDMNTIIERYLDEELIGFGGYDIKDTDRLVRIHAGIDPKYFDEESLTSKDFEYKQGKGRKPAKELRRTAYQKSYDRLINYNIAKAEDPDITLDTFGKIEVKRRKPRSDKLHQPAQHISDYEIEQVLNNASLAEDEIEVEEIVIGGVSYYQDEDGNVYDADSSEIVGKNGKLF